MPASNAMSERSFSTLRRVKTYLRSTMRQDRLNYLMILHVHKERTDALDLKEVANEFVGLNIDIAYSVNLISRYCVHLVYIDQLFYVHFGRASLPLKLTRIHL